MTYTFNTFENLIAWLNSREDDGREVYYYGFWENFDGYCTIADIRKDATPEWFENGATVDIYEKDI